MALTVWAVNEAPANVAAALFLLADKMIAAGWDPVDGGDGTSVTSTAGRVWVVPGDVIAGSWQRLEAGDGQRQIVLQCGAIVGGYARITYAPTGGSAADVTPGTGDVLPEVVGLYENIVGSGTPPGASMFSQFWNDPAFRAACGCASAAGADAGDFYLIGAPIGGGVPVQALVSYEALAFADPADPDPYVWRSFGYAGGGYGVGPGAMYYVSSAGGFHGLGAAVWGGFSGLVLSADQYPYGAARLFPASVPGDKNGAGANPFSGLWDHAPIPIAGSRSAPGSGYGNAGWKGVSTMFRWSGAAVGFGTPTVCSIAGIATGRLAFGHVSVEWPDPAVAWTP